MKVRVGIELSRKLHWQREYMGDSPKSGHRRPRASGPLCGFGYFSGAPLYDGPRACVLPSARIERRSDENQGR